MANRLGCLWCHENKDSQTTETIQAHRPYEGPQAAEESKGWRRVAQRWPLPTHRPCGSNLRTFDASPRQTGNALTEIDKTMKTKSSKQPKQSKPVVRVKDMKSRKNASGGAGNQLYRLFGDANGDRGTAETGNVLSTKPL